MNVTLIDVVGWIGVVSILGAYLLVSIEKVKPTSFWFQVANIVGAVAIGINSFVLYAYPSVAVNIVWTAIGVYAIVKNARKTK